MKTFFFMGLNPRNDSGVSWKIWRIERRGHSVTTWWGAAHVVRRKVVPMSNFGSKSRTFRSDAAAREFEKARIRSKENKGYRRRPRPKR